MSKAVITDVKDQRLVSIKTSDFNITKISESKYRSKITQTIPFRVKFINIGIEGYSPNNPAPIGIAVIGLNNYIL